MLRVGSAGVLLSKAAADSEQWPFAASSGALCCSAVLLPCAMASIPLCRDVVLQSGVMLLSPIRRLPPTVLRCCVVRGSSALLLRGDRLLLWALSKWPMAVV